MLPPVAEALKFGADDTCVSRRVVYKIYVVINSGENAFITTACRRLHTTIMLNSNENEGTIKGECSSEKARG